MKSLKNIFVVVSVLFCISTPAFANRIILEGAAENAKIDVSSSINAFEALGSGDIKIQENAIATVKRNPQLYNPTVFYKLSEILFVKGEKEDAMFWFYAGQLRARYDANRCSDETARSAVSVLNEDYGPQINQYAFQDLDRFEKIMIKVIDFDKNTKHLYDQRWINLHGMGAIMDQMGDNKGPKRTQSLPQEEWPAIAEKTRTDYFNGFQEAMKELRAMKK